MIHLIYVILSKNKEDGKSFKDPGVCKMKKEWLCLLGLYLLAANVAAFSLMGTDKYRAQRGKRRVPERTLFLPIVLGGALGGTLGMRLFHHKTRHWYFRWGYPLLLILQLVVLGWLALGRASF